TPRRSYRPMHVDPPIAVCSYVLHPPALLPFFFLMLRPPPRSTLFPTRRSSDLARRPRPLPLRADRRRPGEGSAHQGRRREADRRSEEHTSESSHDQISYAVFCLKKKKQER